MKVLFFGQIREQLSTGELTIRSPAPTVGDLKQQLAERGESWSEALNHKELLVAVNQTLCDDNQTICDADEVAFFPPVTGG